MYSLPINTHHPRISKNKVEKHTNRSWQEYTINVPQNNSLQLGGQEIEQLSFLSSNQPRNSSFPLVLSSSPLAPLPFLKNFRKTHSSLFFSSFSFCISDSPSQRSLLQPPFLPPFLSHSSCSHLFCHFFFCSHLTAYGTPLQKVPPRVKVLPQLQKARLITYRH